MYLRGSAFGSCVADGEEFSSVTRWPMKDPAPTVLRVTWSSPISDNWTNAVDIWVEAIKRKATPTPKKMPIWHILLQVKL